MRNDESIQSLSDDALLERLTELLRRSRRVESDVVAHIAEVDERRLYAREAASSMFAYATERLHLSEAEAYLRIAVARASRRHPVLLEMLADGRLHLSSIARLAPHLTPDNRDRLLARATHRSKRQIEELLAELAPRPDVPSATRKLPSVTDARSAPPPLQLRPDAVGGAGMPEAPPTARPAPAHASVTPPKKPAVVEPLAPQRYRVQFTASAGLHAKLERLKHLMRSQVPDGDLAALLEVAVTEKLERLEARRFATTRSPRKGPADARTAPVSRYIPAAIRRLVYERDGARCRYVDASGRRCPERHHLEFHHDGTPFGRGGDHSPDNLMLLCSTHNAYLAEREYGAERMARYRRPPDRVSEVTGDEWGVANSVRTQLADGARHHPRLL